MGLMKSGKYTSTAVPRRYEILQNRGIQLFSLRSSENCDAVVRSGQRNSCSAVKNTLKIAISACVARYSRTMDKRRWKGVTCE